MQRCSQLTGAWLPAAGTPLLQGRPGHGNRLVIGPAAQGAWYGGSNRNHSKGHGPNLDLTHGQPRTPGRSLGGNALSGFWFLLTGQKEPPAGSVPTRLASLSPGWLDGQPLSQPCGLPAPLTQGSLWGWSAKKPPQPYAAAAMGPYYFAYSMALVSRIRLTLIWPGYSSSSSIFLAISRARMTMRSSETSSGLIITRTSRPAWMA